MILVTLAILILAYLVYTFCYTGRSCANRMCGKCTTCRSEAFRFHRSDCGCNTCKENFRFRQTADYIPYSEGSDSVMDSAATVNYIKPVDLSNPILKELANVSTVNTGFPLYVNAYGDQLSRGPGKGDPGAVAADAQFVDLYKAAQNLETNFGPFHTTLGYNLGGAISDLNMAQEVNDQLKYELDVQ